MNRQELFASLVFEWQVVVVVWLSSWTEMTEIYWRKDVETGKVCKQEVWQKKKDDKKSMGGWFLPSWLTWKGLLWGLKELRKEPPRQKQQIWHLFVCYLINLLVSLPYHPYSTLTITGQTHQFFTNWDLQVTTGVAGSLVMLNLWKSQV